MEYNTVINKTRQGNKIEYYTCGPESGYPVLYKLKPVNIKRLDYPGILIQTGFFYLYNTDSKTFLHCQVSFPSTTFLTSEMSLGSGFILYILPT